MNEREEVLERIRHAMQPLKKIQDLYYQAVSIDQRNMADQAVSAQSKDKIGSFIGIIAAIVVFGLLDWLEVILCRKVLKTSSLIVMIILVLIAVAISYGVYRFIKGLLTKQSTSLKSAVKSNNERIAAISEEIESIARDNSDVISILPRDYRYYDAAEFMEAAFENGRADSLKEAINLYEEHLHRLRVENINQQVLRSNQLQCKMLENIEYNSANAARGADIAAVFSVLNYLR